MSNWKPVNRKIPNVKKAEVNELSGEYRVKMSYRYKDPYGNTKRTDTAWIVDLTLEKAIEKAYLARDKEKRGKKNSVAVQIEENNTKKKKKTVLDCLNEYRDELFEESLSNQC